MASYVESHRREHLPDPTPIFNTEIVRLGRPPSELEVTLPELQPSDIEEIPGYELLGVLGRGGMGIVFRARQVSLKRQVALKMILTGRNARPEDRLRFQKEAEAVARLQHPNIVQIYEVGQQNGLPYFSLEFVNAGSLAQFLGGAPQAPLVAAQLVWKLAQAMHYAHKRGIVHRDLKPANILLHLDESRILRDGRSADTAVFRELLSYVPKISDFGLAKHVGGDEHLRQGAIVGTPSYMAPEQAGRAGGVGPAADVYALGAILYEMLTGQPPFRAPTAQETAQQVLTQEPIAPVQLQPKIARDLETICLTCLQKDPAARYANADALGEDLRRFLADEPILALPSPLRDRVRNWTRRRPSTTWAFTAGALIAASLIYAWDIQSSAPQGVQPPTQSDLVHTAAHLEQALATIDHLAGDRKAAPAPGSAADAHRQESLRKAVAFYTSLARSDQHQPEMQVIAARAYQRLAELHSALGDLVAASSAYNEAIARFDRLSSAFPMRAEFALHRETCRQQRQALQDAPK